MIEKLKPFTDFKIRLGIINSLVIGKLNYMLPLFVSANLRSKNLIHRVLMRSGHLAIGNYCYKKSITYILSKCGWVDSDQLINKSVVKFIHNILQNQTPTQTFELFRTNQRSKALISTEYFPSKKRMSDFVIYQGVNLYNSLPSKLKSGQRVNLVGK